MQQPFDLIQYDTEQLHIRSFQADDLAAIHAIMNACFGESPLEERQEWLEWVIMNETALRRLYQLPYGDHAVTLKATGQLVGAVGLVPSFGPFARLSAFASRSNIPDAPLHRAEVGLFWAIDPAFRGQGYAAQAARPLIQFMFEVWHLQQIIATTEHTNLASIGVMRQLGMSIERNPQPEPAWFQTIGILENKITSLPSAP